MPRQKASRRKSKKSQRTQAKSKPRRIAKTKRLRPTARQRRTAKRMVRKQPRIQQARREVRKPQLKVAPKGVQAKPQVRTMQTQLAQQETRAIQQQPNLLVTFDPNKHTSAKAEVERLLRDVREQAKVEDSKIHGIFKVTVNDAKATVRKLVEVCKNNPERFTRTFRWTPVDRWCHTDISEMQSVVRDLASNIGERESWKMTIEKRQCDEHERELVEKLTSVIDKTNVNLSDPDRIIKIDILGNETGISLLRRDELLSVSNYRR